MAGKKHQQLKELKCEAAKAILLQWTSLYEQVFKQSLRAYVSTTVIHHLSQRPRPLISNFQRELYTCKTLTVSSNYSMDGKRFASSQNYTLLTTKYVLMSIRILKHNIILPHAWIQTYSNPPCGTVNMSCPNTTKYRPSHSKTMAGRETRWGITPSKDQI